MPINLYKIKKWGAGFIMAFMPTMTFLIFIITTDFIQSIIAFLIVTPVAILLGNRLMSHPVLQYLEGKGLLVLTFDSTGTIESYLVNVNNPYISGMYRGKKAETIFDRDSVFYMGAPQKVEGTMVEDPNYEIINLKVPKNKRNEYMFGFQHFPVLIYNKNLETFLTKEALADLEKDTFVKHMVLYLNRKVEDLTASLRDFARYIVEQTRPRTSWLSSGALKWILLIGVIILLVVILAPFIIETFEGVIAPAAKGSQNIVVPK